MRWIGVLLGVAVGAAFFFFAAPFASLWIGRTLASSGAEGPATPTAASAPIDWSVPVEAPPPSQAGPATPSPDDALKGRSDEPDPIADLKAEAAPPATPTEPR